MGMTRPALHPAYGLRARPPGAGHGAEFDFLELFEPPGGVLVQGSRAGFDLNFSAVCLASLWLTTASCHTW